MIVNRYLNNETPCGHRKTTRNHRELTKSAYHGFRIQTLFIRLVFKRLLYYLFSQVLTHNRRIHATHWFIPLHCNIFRTYNSLFSLVAGS